MPRCKFVVPLEKIELPRIPLETPAVATWTPSPPLRAITLPSAAWVPPIVLNTVPPPERVIPFPVLPSPVVPLDLVPTRFPRIRSLLLFESTIPSPLLPEMRFMSCGVEPPMDSLKLLVVPMKLPAIAVLPPDRLMPLAVNRLITRPRTVEPGPLTVRPVELTPALAPSTSILSTAASMPVTVLAAAPVCE